MGNQQTFLLIRKGIYNIWLPYTSRRQPHGIKQNNYSKPINLLRPILAHSSTSRSTTQSLLRSPKSQQKTCLYQESTTTKICRCSSAAVIRYRKQHPNTFSDVNPSAAPSVVYAQTLRSAVQQIPLQQFLSPWSLPLRTGATSNPPHPFQPPRLVLGEARGTLEVYIDLSCGFS